VVDSTGKPRNTADAPSRANPLGADGFAFIHRCRLLIGSIPNFVGSASTEGKYVTLAATGNTQTGSYAARRRFSNSESMAEALGLTTQNRPM